MGCLHMRFAALAEVNRIVEVEGGPVIGFEVDLQIRCEECMERFAGPNLPGGAMIGTPSTSADGTLHFPIVPMSEWSPPTSFRYNLTGQKARGDA